VVQQSKQNNNHKKTVLLYRGACATTTILLNRLKESNYRRRITHTHWRTHRHSAVSRASASARTHKHTGKRYGGGRILRTKKHSRTHTHTNSRAHSRAHTHTHKRTYTHTNTRIVYQSTVLRRARTVSAHKFLSFIDQSAALLQPATAAAAACPTTSPLSPAPHPHSFDVPGTTFFPYFFYASTLYIIHALRLRCTTRLFSRRCLAPARRLSHRPSLSLTARLLVRSSWSPPPRTSLFARGQQVKTCTDSRTAADALLTWFPDNHRCRCIRPSGTYAKYLWAGYGY